MTNGLKILWNLERRVLRDYRRHVGSVWVFVFHRPASPIDLRRRWESACFGKFFAARYEARSLAFSLLLRPETMCALSCSARRGSAGRLGSVPRLARTIFLAMMVGFTSAQTTCTNTCINRSDGDCDDGGPGAEFSFCDIGTDCADCGPRPNRLPRCSSSGCGSCSNGPLTGTVPTTGTNTNVYYFKTTYYYTCGACSGVASGGGQMHIYQAYLDTGGSTSLPFYLWFDCSNGKWTVSVVPARNSDCRNQYFCPGPYPPSPITYDQYAWSSCPYSGAPTCSASSPPPSTHVHLPHSPSPHSHSPHTHTPHTHIPPSPPNPAPAGSSSRADLATSPGTGWGVSCAAFDGLSDISGGTCTCKTTGWPFATGLQLECLGQISSDLAVGLRMDMQVCQDPMSFTPSIMIPGTGSWQQGTPGNTVNIPTGVNLPLGAGGLDYVITMTGRADNIKLTATVDACLFSACTPLLTLVQIEDQSLGTCAPPWTVPLVAIVSGLAVCLLCGGLVCCGCCCRKTARQADVRGTQLREVASAAPYDTRLNEAFLSATRPSTQVPIAPLATINTVPGLPVFGADGRPI